MTASGRDVPAEVARTREALTTLLARLDPDAADRAAAPPPPARPTVVLVGAPGRGRRELLAALLGLDEVTVEHATHDDLGVPLLEELDLVVPARGPDPGAGRSTAPRRRSCSPTPPPRSAPRSSTRSPARPAGWTPWCSR